MADDKGKPAPAPASSSAWEDPFTEIISVLVVVFLVLYLLNAIAVGVHNNRLFSQGWKAFTKEGVYLAHSLPIAALDNPIGVRVFNKNDVNVYDAPDGNKIGEHKSLEQGKILQGPVDIDELRFWYVDYDTGVDGWVRESGILYLQNNPSLFERILLWIINLVSYIRLIIIILSILAVIGITLLLRELIKLRTAERLLLYIEAKPVATPKNPQWERVLTFIDSPKENDWRQAILEADIILSNLLDKMFLPGETIGEKLKAVEKSDFKTIDNAWEAHKIRNQIAHEGGGFRIDQKEAKRVVDLYKSVFEEFQVI